MREKWLYQDCARINVHMKMCSYTGASFQCESGSESRTRCQPFTVCLCGRLVEGYARDTEGSTRAVLGGREGGKLDWRAEGNGRKLWKSKKRPCGGVKGPQDVEGTFRIGCKRPRFIYE